MTQRIRIIVLLARPAVVVLLGLFAAVGAAQAGLPNNSIVLAKALLVVVAFLLCAVVVNDLSDEAIDRINLPADARRPLVSGACTRSEFVVIGATAGTLALLASLLLHWPAVIVVAAGLALILAYSLRPIRVADRGAMASLLLPAGYVGVPYLVGIFSVRGRVIAGDLLLLAGLYVGFIGRILLKDFRDVRGDALFGKRTFLVRYGRRATCVFSAACWMAGSVAVAGAHQSDRTLAAFWGGLVAIALVLLRALAVDRGVRRDERLISAIAIVGRGMLVTLFAHLSMTSAGWTAAARHAVLAALAAIVVGQVWTMVRRGPSAGRTPVTVPTDWTVPEEAESCPR
jgi:4-hydroxybenzoate polyprenyltransferase